MNIAADVVMVAMLQCTELVNVAMLTGKMQTHAMRIYAVSHSGRLSDVTSQTTCHSGDEDALKVCARIICNDSYWRIRYIFSRHLRAEPPCEGNSYRPYGPKPYCYC